MNKNFLRSLAVTLGILILALTTNAQDAAKTKALHDLFDREWDYALRESPTRASQLGDRRWNDRWTDMSLEAIKRRYAHDLEVRAELAKLDRAALSRADQLNFDLFTNV